MAREGIEVFSPDGESFGRSIEAGKRALGQVIATRVALPVPVLLLPPVIIEGLSVLRFLPNGRGRALADIGLNPPLPVCPTLRYFER